MRRPLTRDVRLKNMKTIIACLCLSTGSAAFASSNAPPNSIDQRLDAIIIPAAEFRDAHTVDVLEFLLSAAIDIPDKLTASISLALGYREPERLDHSLPAVTNLHLLTINVRRMVLRDLLNNVTKTQNLRYKVTATNILIFTSDGILLNKR